MQIVDLDFKIFQVFYFHLIMDKYIRHNRCRITYIANATAAKKYEKTTLKFVRIIPYAKRKQSCFQMQK